MGGVDCLHPREILLLAVAIFLGMSLVLIAACSPDEELDDLNHWRERPWQRVEECRIRQSGIAYLGDCGNHSTASVRMFHNRPKYNYSTCVDPKQPAVCSTAVRAAFYRQRRLDGLEAARPRRLKERVGQMCRDAFTVWAFVDVADHSTCGYPFGLLSQSADTRWNRVQGELGTRRHLFAMGICMAV